MNGTTVNRPKTTIPEWLRRPFPAARAATAVEAQHDRLAAKPAAAQKITYSGYCIYPPAERRITPMCHPGCGTCDYLGRNGGNCGGVCLGGNGTRLPICHSACEPAIEASVRASQLYDQWCARCARRTVERCPGLVVRLGEGMGNPICFARAAAGDETEADLGGATTRRDTTPSASTTCLAGPTAERPDAEPPPVGILLEQR